MKPPPALTLGMSSNSGNRTLAMLTPAARSLASARSKAADTGPSMPSRMKFAGSASRRPDSAKGVSGAGDPPARIASTAAAQATEGASGPTESMLGDSGSTPSIGTRRAVGL